MSTREENLQKFLESIKALGMSMEQATAIFDQLIAAHRTPVAKHICARAMVYEHFERIKKWLRVAEEANYKKEMGS